MINVNVENPELLARAINLNHVINEDEINRINIDKFTAEKLLMQDDRLEEHDLLNFQRQKEIVMNKSMFRRPRLSEGLVD